MSYYLLPKNINNILVNPQYSIKKQKPYISTSFLTYYSEIKSQINELESEPSFEETIKIINPYEFVFSKVPGSKFSVSKLKLNNNIFYDLLEIYNNLNVIDSFKDIHTINALHISPHYSDAIECFEIFREGNIDLFYSCSSININNELNDTKMDFIFYETELSGTNYFASLIQALIVILRNQSKGGVTVIKIGNTTYKPVVDILYYLSSLFDKTYIIKPSTNNITYFDKYIVCKSFLYDPQTVPYLKLNCLKLLLFLKRLDSKYIISSILDFDIPYYFKNKIDDLNIIIGQKQIEALDNILSIYKNKNNDEKIENLKKNNIQKAVSWCEKYKIPCNKFTDKINIFLPIINNEE